METWDTQAHSQENCVRAFFRLETHYTHATDLQAKSQISLAVVP